MTNGDGEFDRDDGSVDGDNADDDAAVDGGGRGRATPSVEALKPFETRHSGSKPSSALWPKDGSHPGRARRALGLGSLERGEGQGSLRFVAFKILRGFGV